MKQNVVAGAVLFASVTVFAGCHTAPSVATGKYAVAPPPLANSTVPNTPAALASLTGELPPAFPLTTLVGGIGGNR